MPAWSRCFVSFSGLSISIKSLQCLCFWISLVVYGELCIISFLAQSKPRGCKYILPDLKNVGPEVSFFCQALLGSMHHIKKLNSFIGLFRSRPFFITPVNICNSSTENSLNLMLALNIAPRLIYFFFFPDSKRNLCIHMHISTLFSKLDLFFF